MRFDRATKHQLYAVQVLDQKIQIMQQSHPPIHAHLTLKIIMCIPNRAIKANYTQQTTITYKLKMNLLV